MSETAKLPPVAELYACACGHEHFECERCHTHHTFPNRDGLLLRLLAKLKHIRETLQQQDAD